VGLIALLGAGAAGVAYLVRNRPAVTRLRVLAVPQFESGPAGTIRSHPVAIRGPLGNRGWLLVYMVGLAAELVHGLVLTVGSVIVYADPSLAGLESFVPLWALLFYVVSNLFLLAYGVVLFGLMLSKRKAAIVNNILFNALSVVFLVTWFVLGAKSPFGTIVDSLPGLAAIAYFSSSRRVRNTYTAT